jgi:hypothetical protein
LKTRDGRSAGPAHRSNPNLPSPQYGHKKEKRRNGLRSSCFTSSLQSAYVKASHTKENCFLAMCTHMRLPGIFTQCTRKTYASTTASSSGLTGPTSTSSFAATTNHPAAWALRQPKATPKRQHLRRFADDRRDAIKKELKDRYGEPERGGVNGSR